MKHLSSVKVMKSEDGFSWREIYRGIVVRSTNEFVRVFQARTRDDWKTGDVNIESSEYFPINGKRIKVELC